MPYPAYMEESIRKVEGTRERRLKEELPRIPVGKRMLEFGTTRVELGVQTLDDEIHRSTKRGHGVAEVDYGGGGVSIRKPRRC